MDLKCVVEVCCGVAERGASIKASQTHAKTREYRRVPLGQVAAAPCVYQLM